MKSSQPKAPKHLKPATRAWVRTVLSDYEMEGHHHRMLVLAAETYDRACEARDQITLDGPYVKDRYGCLKV